MPFLRLSQPVGDNKPNRKEDVRQLGLALRTVGYLEPDALDVASGATGRLFGSVRSLQGDHGLRVDGVVTPEGETEQAINNSLLGKPRGAVLMERPPIALQAAVGDGQANRSADVKQVKVALGGLGLMPEDPSDDPHGFVDHPMLEGLKRFQEKQGLKTDGIVAPAGPTEARLNEATEHRRGEIASLVGDYRRRTAAAGLDGSRTKRDQTQGIGPIHTQLPPGFWSRRIEPIPGPLPLPLPLPLPIPRIFPRLIAPPTTPIIPGRPIRPNPPTIYKGPDPRGRPAPDAAPPGFPSKPPKLPGKEEIKREHPLIRDAIEIFPDQSEDWNQPVIVENRQGTPPTKALNADLSDGTRHAGDVIYVDRFEQIGGPGEKRDEDYSEYYLPNWKTRNQRPRTTKGSSYTDASFRIRLPKNDANGNPRYVYIHLDTYTPNKRTGKPNAREQRQYNKLLYNERGYAFIVRVPKLGENEALDKLAWDNYIWNVMMRIKKGIENGAFDNPRNARRVELLFRPIKRR